MFARGIRLSFHNYCIPSSDFLKWVSYKPTKGIKQLLFTVRLRTQYFKWTPLSSNGKESACNAGHPGWIPGSGRSSGEENDYPLQYSCLENPMDREAWRATVCGITKIRTQLSD